MSHEVILIIIKKNSSWTYITSQVFERNQYFIQGCIKLIKSESKDIYDVSKSISKKYYYFLFCSSQFIEESWFFLIMFPQLSTAQLFSTLILIINVSWAANQHIRMISEGSCENSVLITAINYILKYIYIENSSFTLQKYFTMLLFYCIFDQRNTALVSIRHFFKNITNSHQNLLFKCVKDFYLQLKLLVYCDGQFKVEK